MGKTFSLFIAKRLRNTPSQTFSKNVTRIGIGTIALGVAILILSFSILRGFQNKIYDKIYDLNGHVQINLFVNQNTSSPKFFENDQKWIQKIKNNSLIDTVYEIIQSPSLVISESSMHGLILSNFHPSSYTPWQNQDENTLFLSKNLIKILDTKIKDRLTVYFIGDQPLPRRVHLTNSYSTGLEEIDQNIGFASTSWLRKSLKIGDSQVSGFQIFLKDREKSEQFLAEIRQIVPPEFSIRRMEEIYPGLFDWMKLLDKNILLLIGLLIIVAGFNIIATLYILIIERIPMIGVLKSFGAQQSQLKSIFWWNGTFILWRGLFIGNFVGIGLSILQSTYQLIPLNAEIYYMEYVPIEINYMSLVFINLLTIIFVLIISNIPTRYLDKLNPLEAINYKN